MKYTDGCAVLNLCDQFEKISKKLLGEYRGKCGIESHRKLVDKVRKIVEDDV